MVTLRKGKTQSNARNKYGQTVISKEFSRTLFKLELNSFRCGIINLWFILLVKFQLTGSLYLSGLSILVARLFAELSENG